MVLGIDIKVGLHTFKIDRWRAMRDVSETACKTFTWVASEAWRASFTTQIKYLYARRGKTGEDKKYDRTTLRRERTMVTWVIFPAFNAGKRVNGRMKREVIARTVETVELEEQMKTDVYEDVGERDES